METKKYSSYAQIECELEILKLEKELNLQKIVLNVQRTKESLSPKNLIKEFLEYYNIILSNPTRLILNTGVPLIINWFTKRKRGY